MCIRDRSGPAGVDGKETGRKFTVRVSNVSDHLQSVGIYDYQDQAELLGLSVKELYEKSLKQTLAVGQAYSFETKSTGMAITYNYKDEGLAYGKRLRWRAGGNRDIFMEYEFKNLDEGALVQISEN